MTSYDVNYMRIARTIVYFCVDSIRTVSDLSDLLKLKVVTLVLIVSLGRAGGNTFRPMLVLERVDRLVGVLKCYMVLGVGILIFQLYVLYRITFHDKDEIIRQLRDI